MNPYRYIRRGRIAIQAIIAIAITAAIATGSPAVFSRMQLIPAIAACSIGWLLIWLLLTLTFGRIYCSLACPCGAMMALINTLLPPKSRRYRYKVPATRMRISILVIVVICACMGISLIVSLLDPYSAYSRMVTAVIRPTFIGTAGLVTAIATLALIVIFSARRGRDICTSVCPVGTSLGLLSKASLMHADINTDLCVNCRKCESVCAASCIDLTSHTVDYSRCVVCFHCMEVCSNGAITFRRGRHHLTMPMLQRIPDASGVSAMTQADCTTPSTQTGRRSFIVAAMATAAAATGLQAKPKSKPSLVKGATPLRPLNYVTPPGSRSREEFLSKCTGCNACTAACPTHVITSSSGQLGLRHALMPVLDFDRAYCSFDCKACTDVCPSGALNPLELNEKRATPIGRAKIVCTNCRLYVNGTHCGICARVCPKRAISIMPTTDGRRAPVLTPELCIGCGRCSNACPSKPYKAIVIEGL